MAVALVVLMALMTAPIAAAPHDGWSDQNGFYQRKSEGWFWYDDPVDLPEPEIEPEPEPEIDVLAIDAENLDVDEDPGYSGPPVFSASWIREQLPKYLNAAIDEPSVENVQAYMYLQRLMMDKSERFAFATQRVVSGDPMLDEATRRPLATFAVHGVDVKAGQLRTELLKKIAGSTGIFFFFSSNCQECEVQAPLIKNLQDHLGFAVVPISVDGKASDSFPWQDYRTDNGQAQALNVKALPALYLASADGEFELIGQSIFSQPELQDRILFAAARKGWVSDEELNATRPILDSTNIAELISNRSDDTAMPDADEGGVVPPEQLMRYIKSSLEVTP